MYCLVCTGSQASHGLKGQTTCQAEGQADGSAGVAVAKHGHEPSADPYGGRVSASGGGGCCQQCGNRLGMEWQKRCACLHARLWNG
jgi:hypothetical protein